MCSEFGYARFGTTFHTTFHGHGGGHGHSGRGGSGAFVTPVYGGMAPWYPYASDPQYYDAVTYNPHNEFSTMTYGREGRR